MVFPPVSNSLQVSAPIVQEQTRTFAETPPILKGGWADCFRIAPQVLVFPQRAASCRFQICASLEGEQAELIDFHFLQQDSHPSWPAIPAGLLGRVGSFLPVRCRRVDQTGSSLAGRRLAYWSGELDLPVPRDEL